MHTVRTLTRSKLQAYLSMNPQMSVSQVYSQLNPYIPEHHRVQYTRLRLVSHNLRIETGRWARLPREQRLCRCGQVQTERHVIEECSLTRLIRDNNSHIKFSIPELFEHSDQKDICRLLSEILDIIYEC